MRAKVIVWLVVMLVGGVAPACSWVEPPTAQPGAPSFPEDKAGAELEAGYASMRAAFARENPAWDVIRVAADQPSWEAARGDRSRERAARVFVGVRDRGEPSRCGIVITTFVEERADNRSWGAPRASAYGVNPNPRISHRVGDLDNPLPISCPLLGQP